MARRAAGTGSSKPATPRTRSRPCSATGRCAGLSAAPLMQSLAVVPIFEEPKKLSLGRYMSAAAPFSGVRPVTTRRANAHTSFRTKAQASFDYRHQTPAAKADGRRRAQESRGRSNRNSGWRASEAGWRPGEDRLRRSPHFRHSGGSCRRPPAVCRRRFARGDLIALRVSCFTRRQPAAR
jgi:hypothetical protein